MKITLDHLTEEEFHHFTEPAVDIVLFVTANGYPAVASKANIIKIDKIRDPNSMPTSHYRCMVVLQSVSLIPPKAD